MRVLSGEANPFQSTCGARDNRAGEMNNHAAGCDILCKSKPVQRRKKRNVNVFQPTNVLCKQCCTWLAAEVPTLHSKRCSARRLQTWAPSISPAMSFILLGRLDMYVLCMSTSSIVSLLMASVFSISTYLALTDSISFIGIVERSTLSFNTRFSNLLTS